MNKHQITRWVRPLMAMLCIALSALAVHADFTVWVYGPSTAPYLQQWSSSYTDSQINEGTVINTTGTWYYKTFSGSGSINFRFTTGNWANETYGFYYDNPSGDYYFYYDGSGFAIDLTPLKNKTNNVFLKATNDRWNKDGATFKFADNAMTAIGGDKSSYVIYYYATSSAISSGSKKFARCSSDGNSQWNSFSATYTNHYLYEETGWDNSYNSSLASWGNVTYPEITVTTYSATFYIYSTSTPTMSGVTFTTEANDNSDDTKDAMFNWYKGTYSSTTWSGNVSFTANGSTKTLTLGTTIADGGTYYFDSSNYATTADYNPFDGNSQTIYVKGQTDPLLHAWFVGVDGSDHSVTANSGLVWDQDATNQEKLTQTTTINGYTWYYITITDYPAIKATAYKTGVGSANLNSGNAFSTDWYFGFTGNGTKDYDAATAPAAPVPLVYVAGDFTNWNDNKVQLTETSTSGVYIGQVTLTNPVNTFKFVYNNNNGGSDQWTGATAGTTVTTTNCNDIEFSTFGNGDNITIHGTGTVTFTVNINNNTFSVSNLVAPQPKMYLAGNFTNPTWADGKLVMTENANGTYTLTVNGMAVDNEFKFIYDDGIGNLTWYGGASDPTTVSATACNNVAMTGTNNFKLYGSGNLTFTVAANRQSFSVSGITAPTEYTYNVYVRNTGSADAPNLYVWDGNYVSGTYNSYPGPQGTTTENVSAYDWYKFTFTSITSSVKVIASINGDDHKTDNIPVAAGNYYIVFDGTASSTITPSYSSATAPGAPVFYMHGNFAGGDTWSHTESMTYKNDGTFTYEAQLEASQTLYFFVSDIDSNDWTALDGHRYAEGNNQVIYENRVTTCVPVSNGTYVFNTGVAGKYIFTYNFTNNTMTVEREKTQHHVRIYVYDRNGQADHLLLYAFRSMSDNGYINNPWPGVSFNNTNQEVINGQTWYYMDLDIEDDRFTVIPNLGDGAWQTGNLVVSAFYDAWYIAVDTSKEKQTDAATYYVKNTVPSEAVPSHWYIKADWGDENGWQGTEELTAVTSNELSVTKRFEANQTAYMFVADATMTADQWDAAHRYAASTSDTEIKIGSEYDALAEQNGGTYKFVAPASKQYTFTLNTTTMKFSVKEAIGKAVIIHLEKTDNVTDPQIWAWDKERYPNGVEIHVDRPSINELLTNRFDFTEAKNNMFYLDTYKSESDGRTWYTWEVDNNICEFVLTRGKTSLTAANYGNSDNVTDIQWRRSGEIFITWDDELGLVDQTRDYDTHAAKESPTAARMLEGHYYVYFINTLDWPQAYIHAWHKDSEGVNHDLLPVGAARYPGERLSEIVGHTEDGHEVYLFDFGYIEDWQGENEPTGMLFSIGDSSGGMQTSDFVFSNGAVYDYTGSVVLGRSLGNIIANGVVDGAPYTVEDDLIAVYFDPDDRETYTTTDGQTHTSYGALYCKDLNMFKTTPVVTRSVQKTGEIDYVKELTPLMDHLNGRYDQSNWVKLTLSSQYPGYSNDKDDQLDILGALQGKILTAGSVRGVLVNNINPQIRLTHSDAGESAGVETGANSTYNCNVYTTANFLGTHQGAAGQQHDYFFVTPKPNEYAEITWAVADNVDMENGTAEFFIPVPGQDVNGVDNEADLNGYFKADLSKLTPETTIVANKSYKFRAIIAIDEDKYNAASSSNPAPRRRAGETYDHKTKVDNNYIVYPLAVQDTITGINNLKDGNGKVTGVSYVNMAGQTSSKPFEGVNIVVTTYSDGSRSAVKVIR